MSQQPKPAFYFVVLLVILSLLGYAFYRFQNRAADAPAVVQAQGQSQADTNPVDAPPGSILLQEGEVGDAAYVVVYGNLRVSHDVNGKHLNLALLRPGDYFGEWSLLTGAPRTATVSSLSQAELVCIERGAFLDVLKDNPEIRDRIDLEAHNRYDKMMSLEQGSPEQRAHQSLNRIVDIIKKSS